MEIFMYADKVRIRSSQTGKYLAADRNGSVFQSRRNTSAPDEDEALVWEVKQFRATKSVVRLRSSYGGFLTGSTHNFLLGWTGKKVIQTNPTKADDLFEWEPVQESGTLIRLRTRDATCLRANGGAPPWRNSVTHDHLEKKESHRNLLWEVELVQEKEYSQVIPSE